MSIIYNPPAGAVPGNLSVPGTLTTTELLSAGSIATPGTVNAAVLLASGSVRGGNLSTAGTAVFAVLALGGTVGRWAFGTVGLTSGVGTIATGLTTVQSAVASPIGVDSGLGSLSSLQVDLSLGAAGSVIFRGLTSVLPFSANATVAWQAFGR